MDPVSIDNAVRTLEFVKTEKNRAVVHLEEIATSLNTTSQTDPLVVKAVVDIKNVIKYLAPL